MRKNNLTDFLIILLLLLAISSFPFNLLERFIVVKNFWIIDYSLKILFLSLLFVFFRSFLKKRTNLNIETQKVDKRYVPLFIPVFLICFSNFAYFMFCPEDMMFSFNWSMILEIVLYFVVALNEELVFRLVFINNSEAKYDWLKVLFSALVFALCHLTGFLSSFNPAALVQVGYTFVLGLILGSLYYFTHSFTLCVALHFSFNVINDVGFSMCIGSVSNDLAYYISNILVGALVLLYILLIWHYYYKNESPLLN